MSRSWQWNGRRLLVISGLVGLSFTAPAAAETTGERALLNQAGPRLLVDRKPQARVVDGAQALLSRPGSSEASLGLRGGTEGRAAANALRIDGRRALLGVQAVPFHGVAPGR